MKVVESANVIEVTNQPGYLEKLETLQQRYTKKPQTRVLKQRRKNKQKLLMYSCIFFFLLQFSTQTYFPILIFFFSGCLYVKKLWLSIWKRSA